VIYEEIRLTGGAVAPAAPPVDPPLFPEVRGPSRWNIAKGPFVYSLRQRKKISYALGEERQIKNIF